VKRQTAVIAMLAATVGLISRKATMADENNGVVSLSDWNKPKTLTFGLDGFKEFTFTHDGQKVTLSTAEIFAALKE